MWKYSKWPFTPHIPILQLVTWPPGLVPEPNCDTKLCCREGSTHLPTQNNTHIQLTHILFNITSLTGDQSKPESFVWTTRREGTYSVGIQLHLDCRAVFQFDHLRPTTSPYSVPKCIPSLWAVSLSDESVNKTATQCESDHDRLAVPSQM